MGAAQAGDDEHRTRLAAVPNPVPAGLGLGTTVIAWATCDGSFAQVYVFDEDGNETLFAEGVSGCAAATWITSGRTWTFRLFAGTDKAKLLDAVDVTRDSAPDDERRAQLTAVPNPIPGGLAAAATAINWTTDDGSVGQVYVSDGDGNETLFAEGVSGSAGATWITSGRTWTFSLFAGTDKEKLLGAVDVTRDDVPWAELAQDLAERARGDESADDVASALVPSLAEYLHGRRYADVFRLWEEQGIHVTPVHFYFPVPDTRTLSDELWEARSELVGLDLQVEKQLQLVREAFPAFRAEYDQFPREPTDRPHEYFFDNALFSGTDALILYCMVRHFEPRLIVEVGSGFSSRVSAQAALRNPDTELVCIEPYHDGTERHELLRRGFPGLSSLVTEKVEDLDPSFFRRLQAGDILFIDTSHVVQIGGDVTFLFLEVLPRLHPGVMVHVHDIFLPFEYPRERVLDELYFFNEQYLLQAFLAFNPEFEVVLANHFLGRVHKDDLVAAFPNSPWWGGSSFWIRRIDEA